jgi:hypothetical protein
MKGFVSSRSILAVTLAASMSVFWVAFIVPVAGIRAAALMGVLMLATALLISMRSGRSMAQVIRDVETEPIPLVATARVPPVRRAVL